MDMFESENVKVELWTMCALECVAIGNTQQAENMLERGIRCKSGI